MDTVENAALETLFELKKKQQDGIKPKTMYQCIPAQFIDMVSRVGFHTEFAPPDGILFFKLLYLLLQITFDIENSLQLVHDSFLGLKLEYRKG